MKENIKTLIVVLVALLVYDLVIKKMVLKSTYEGDFEEAEVE